MINGKKVVASILSLASFVAFSAVIPNLTAAAILLQTKDQVRTQTTGFPMQTRDRLQTQSPSALQTRDQLRIRSPLQTKDQIRLQTPTPLGPDGGRR